MRNGLIFKCFELALNLKFLSIQFCSRWTLISKEIQPSNIQNWEFHTDWKFIPAFRHRVKNALNNNKFSTYACRLHICIWEIFRFKDEKKKANETWMHPRFFSPMKLCNWRDAMEHAACTYRREKYAQIFSYIISSIFITKR